MADINKLKKILAVDDEEISLSLVKNFLKDEYEVITAKSGIEALEHLDNKLVPDLILLDILMPVMDGWETFNRIRGISSLHDTPIAFLTSVNKPEDIKYAREIGAADYIVKPYNKANQLERIKDMIGYY